MQACTTAATTPAAGAAMGGAPIMARGAGAAEAAAQAAGGCCGQASDPTGDATVRASPRDRRTCGGRQETGAGAATVSTMAGRPAATRLGTTVVPGASATLKRAAAAVSTLPILTGEVAAQKPCTRALAAAAG
ncbi:unnamed protein product [Prorocentrum cordatum]|uniref:Uncharacterized protein n=1 Tax=Prorocentrum cordatum TaxID=2364126 RepID=A0ABN9SPB5_9DINO|nr:unnamed protein product [Polarella glacialis]